MPSSEYPDAVLAYVQDQGWNADLTEVQEGVYIVAGARKTENQTEKILVMAVCKPETEITSKHVNYLLKTGREKDVDLVQITHTVGLTDNARKVAKEYNIGAIKPKKIRSYTAANESDIDSDETSTSVSTANNQVGPSHTSELKERAKEIVAQAKGSSVTEKFLLDKKRLTEDTEQSLADQSLIEYLHEDEIPDYIFLSDLQESSLPDQDLNLASDHRAVCVISDKRVLLVIGAKNSDQVVSIPYDTISRVEFSPGSPSHLLTITPSDNTSEDYHLHISPDSVDSDEEIRTAETIIEQRLPDESDPDDQTSTEQSGSKQSIQKHISSGKFIGGVIFELSQIALILLILFTVVGFISPFSLPIFDASDDIQDLVSEDSSLSLFSLSPEETTRAYFEAHYQGNYDEAISYASNKAASNYSREQFDAFASEEPRVEEMAGTAGNSEWKRVLVAVSAETSLGRDGILMEVYLENQNDGWQITQVCYYSGGCQSGLGVKNIE